MDESTQPEPGAPTPPPPAAPPAPPTPPPAGPPPAGWPTPASPQGWTPESAWTAAPPPRGSRRIWVIGCLVLVVLLVVGVASCSFALFRSFGGAGAVVAASHGEIEQFNAFSGTGGTTITFVAARGVDETDGPRIACAVIVPTLAGSDLATARWVLVNRAGDVIASNETRCP